MRTRSQTAAAAAAATTSAAAAEPSASGAFFSSEAMRVCVECIREGRVADIPYAYAPYVVVADHFVRACLVEQIERDARERESKPEQLLVVWCFGPPGAGKSWRVRATNPGAYHARLDGKKIRFDGYRGEEVVVLDQLRMHPSSHATDIHALIPLVEKYAFRAEIRDGMSVCIRPKKVVIVSQHSFQDLYGGLPECAKLARCIDVVHCITSPQEPPIPPPAPPAQLPRYECSDCV